MRDISKCLQGRAGSLGAPARTQLLPQKLEQAGKNHVQRLASNGLNASLLIDGWRCWRSELLSHGAGGFILTAGLFTAPSVWHRKEKLYQPAEILILSTPILEFQQLQLVLEALLGGLLGGLFQ